MMLRILLLSIIAFVLLIHAYTRTTNVLPGESDYPSLRVKPVEFVRVTFQIPRSVHVNFTLVYAGTFGRDSHPKPSACHYLVRTGSETEYTVSLHAYWKADPLVLNFEGRLPDEPGNSRNVEIYSASIPVDKYEAARCHWQFYELTYSLEDDPQTQMPVFAYSSGAQAGTLDVFRFLCAKLDATREIGAREICGGPRIDYVTLQYLRPEDRNRFFNDPQAMVRNESVASGSAVTVEFNDIDDVVPFPLVTPH